MRLSERHKPPAKHDRENFSLRDKSDRSQSFLVNNTQCETLRTPCVNHQQMKTKTLYVVLS